MRLFSFDDLSLEKKYKLHVYIYIYIYIYMYVSLHSSSIKMILKNKAPILINFDIFVDDISIVKKSQYEI